MTSVDSGRRDFASERDIVRDVVTYGVVGYTNGASASSRGVEAAQSAQGVLGAVLDALHHDEAPEAFAPHPGYGIEDLRRAAAELGNLLMAAARQGTEGATT